METLWQDIRFGIRMLARKPGFTVVAVLTLALGIGATTAIFSVINGVLLRPLPFDEPDRIVSLAERSKDGTARNVGYATVVDWRAESETFEFISAYRWWDPVLTGDGTPERLTGLRVSDTFFDVLGVKPILGRNFLPEEDQPDHDRPAMLSHALWKRRFSADPEIIGKPVTLSGGSYIIVGVLPAEFQPVVSTLEYDRAEIWSTIAYDVSASWACRSCRHLKAIGRLAAGSTLEDAQAEIGTMAARMKQDYPDEYSGRGVDLTRLLDKIVGGTRPALLLLLGAVGFVLLIACANVANLLLARASSREKEFAIRASLGAGRRRLIRQLLTESLLLALAGGTGGVLLSLWGVDALKALSSANLPRLDAVRVDAWVLGSAFFASLATGILFGLAPALLGVRAGLNETLKQGGRSLHGGSRRLRNVLVIAETALALVLLTGGALLLNSFLRLARVDPGFDTRNVLTFKVTVTGEKFSADEQVHAYYEEVAGRIVALPAVESAGWASNLPLSGSYDRYGMPIEDRPEIEPADRPAVDRYSIGADYLRVMRIPLLRGRSFTAQDNFEAPLVALINKTLAERFWPEDDAIGKRIRMGGGQDAWRTIIGIVSDVRHYGLAVEPSMQAYIPQAQGSVNESSRWVVRTSADPMSLAAAIRSEFWAVDADQPVYEFSTMERHAVSTIAQQRFTMLLTGLFAAVALVLAAIGLYGVISYSVNQRVHEIGVRMALGANQRDIFRLVVGQGVTLALIGLAAGLVTALALTRFLAGMLYEVNPADPGTYVGVSILLMAVAVLACYIPARRAAKVDPMVALRYE